MELSASGANLLRGESDPGNDATREKGHFERFGEAELAKHARAHDAMTAMWARVARVILGCLPIFRVATCCLTLCTVLLAAAVIGLFATSDVYRIDGGTMFIPRTHGWELECAYNATAYIMEGDSSVGLSTGTGAPGSDSAWTCDHMHLSTGAACPSRISQGTMTSLIIAMGVLLPWLVVFRCALMMEDTRQEIGKFGHISSLAFIKLYESVYRNSFFLAQSDYLPFVGPACQVTSNVLPNKHFILGAIFPQSLEADLPSISICTIVYGAILVGLLRPASSNNPDLVEFRFRMLRDRVSGKRRWLWHLFIVGLTALFLYSTMWFCTSIFLANILPRFAHEVGVAFGALVQFSVADLFVIFRGDTRVHEPWYSPFYMLRWITNAQLVMDLMLILLAVAKSKSKGARPSQSAEPPADGATKSTCQRFCCGSCSMTGLVHFFQVPHLFLKGPLFFFERLIYKVLRSIITLVHGIAMFVSICGTCLGVLAVLVCAIAIAATVGKAGNVVMVDGSYAVFPIKGASLESQASLGVCAHFAVTEAGNGIEHLPSIECTQYAAPQLGDAPECVAYQSPVATLDADNVSMEFAAGSVLVFTFAALASVRRGLLRRIISVPASRDRSTKEVWQFFGYATSTMLATCVLMSTFRNGWSQKVHTLLPNGKPVDCLAYVIPVWTSSRATTGLEACFVLFGVFYFFALPLFFRKPASRTALLEPRCCSASGRTMAYVAGGISIFGGCLLLVTVLTVPILRSMTPNLFNDLHGWRRMAQLWLVDTSLLTSSVSLNDGEAFSFFTILRWTALSMTLIDALLIGISLLDRATQVADSFTTRRDLVQDVSRPPPSSLEAPLLDEADPETAGRY